MSKKLQTPFQSTFRTGRVTFTAIGLIVALFLFLPMLVSIAASFNSGDFIQVPPEGFSFRWYGEVLNDSAWIDALLTSLKISVSAATLAIITAFLAVTGLARSRRLARVMRPLFFLPMVFPIIVLALGFSRMMAFFGLKSSLWSVILGEALLCIPIAFVAVSAGMVNIDPALRRAAESMGATWWRTVFTIDLPLLKQSLFGGFILAFAFSFDEAVLGLFLAPTGETPLPVLLYNQAFYRVTPQIAAVSGYIIVLTVIVAIAAALINRSLGRRGTRAPSA